MRVPDLEIRVKLEDKQALQRLKNLKTEIRGLNKELGQTGAASKRAAGATDKYRRSTQKAAKETFRFRVVTKETRRAVGAIRNELLLVSFAFATIAAGFGTLVTQFTGAFGQLQKATSGLKAVAGAMGQLPQQAAAAARGIVELTGGLINVAQASQAMKQGLVMGRTIQEVTTLVLALADAAVYNAQGMYSAGEAVTITMQGIKNFMSVTADAAGVTKNLSVMLREWERQTGKSAAALSDFEKYAILFKSFQKEASVFRDNLQGFLKTFVGLAQKLKTDFFMLRAEIGEKLVPVVTELYISVGKLIEKAREHNQLWTDFIGLGIQAAVRGVANAVGFLAANLLLVKSALEAITAIAIVAGIGNLIRHFGALRRLFAWYAIRGVGAATFGTALLTKRFGFLARALVWVGRGLGMARLGFLGMAGGIGIVLAILTALIVGLRAAWPLMQKIGEKFEARGAAVQAAREAAILEAGPGAGLPSGSREAQIRGMGEGRPATLGRGAAIGFSLSHTRHTFPWVGEEMSYEAIRGRQLAGKLQGIGELMKEIGGEPVSIEQAEKRLKEAREAVKGFTELHADIAKLASEAGRDFPSADWTAYWVAVTGSVESLVSYIETAERANVVQRLQNLTKGIRGAMALEGIDPSNFQLIADKFDEAVTFIASRLDKLQLTEEQRRGIGLQLLAEDANVLQGQLAKLKPFLSPAEYTHEWAVMVKNVMDLADRIEKDLSPAAKKFMDNYVAGLIDATGWTKSLDKELEDLAKRLKESHEWYAGFVGPYPDVFRMPAPREPTVPTGPPAFEDLKEGLGFPYETGLFDMAVEDIKLYAELVGDRMADMQDLVIQAHEAMAAGATQIWGDFWMGRISMEQAGWLTLENAARETMAGTLDYLKIYLTEELKAWAKVWALKGAAKIAESLWPPNPLGIASGLKMLAVATAAGAAAGLVGGMLGGGAAAIRERGAESREHYLPEGYAAEQRRLRREGEAQQRWGPRGDERSRFGAITARQEEVNVTISIHISGDTVIVGPNGIEEAAGALAGVVDGIVQDGIRDNRYDFGRMATR